MLFAMAIVITLQIQMRKIAFILFISAFWLTSCNKEETKPMSKEDISKKVDSISKIRMKEQDEIAQQDLQRRMKIEVKIKVDSILNAMKTKSDSAVNAINAAKAKDSIAKTTTPAAK